MENASFKMLMLQGLWILLLVISVDLRTTVRWNSDGSSWNGVDTAEKPPNSSVKLFHISDSDRNNGRNDSGSLSQNYNNNRYKNVSDVGNIEENRQRTLGGSIESEPEQKAEEISIGSRSHLEKIRAAVILPGKDSDYNISLSRVMPVLELARREVYKRGLLPNHELVFFQDDDQCESVYAQYLSGVTQASNKVHVFFGPICEYCIGKLLNL